MSSQRQESLVFMLTLGPGQCVTWHNEQKHLRKDKEGQSRGYFWQFLLAHSMAHLAVFCHLKICKLYSTNCDCALYLQLKIILNIFYTGHCVNEGKTIVSFSSYFTLFVIIVL